MFITIIFCQARFIDFHTRQFKSFSNSKYLAITFSINFKSSKVSTCFSALYLLWNVLIVKLAKLYTVNFYVFLSALYTLQYVPIVTILVIVSLFKKKKNDPYSGMGKNATIPRYLSFSWEREGILTSQNLTLKLSTSALSALPPAQKRFRQSVDDARQNCPKYVYFSHFPEFWERHDSLALWARETPKILPRNT